MSLLQKIYRLIPSYRHLERELKKYKIFHPPGHYYSPIPSIDELRDRENEIFKTELDLSAFNFSDHSHRVILKILENYHSKFNFERQECKTRYHWDNEYFGSPDGLILFGMIQLFNPARLVEIGSGYSSALILDTLELNNQPEECVTTFIEPFPARLKTLLRGTDGIQIMEKPVQAMSLDFFETLDKNDILFVDSSHVVKAGSDLHYIIFHVLPRLRTGTIIHFHDIFYPFEYPREWLINPENNPFRVGFAWNEAYFLRAYLMDNSNYEILAFNNYSQRELKERYNTVYPLFYTNQSSSFWIRKIA